MNSFTDVREDRMDTQYRNEEEKMLAGVLYDPAKDGLPGKRTRAHDLCREFNMLSETEEKIVQIIIEEINADLALGKISAIYFTDYLFLE